MARNPGGGAYPHHRLRWINAGFICAVSPNHGWLLWRNGHTTLLLNPVIGARIPLPSTTISIAKASITSSPSAPTGAKACYCYVLVLHYSSVMSICKLGDTDWRYVESGSEAVYKDAICFSGKFYVLMSNGDLSAIDKDQFGAASPVTSHVAHLDLLSLGEELDPEAEFSSRLVEIGGELMALVHYPNRKKMFEIHKLDLSTGNWVSVEENFGDYALFVGDGQAFALHMDDVPADGDLYKCIMANHIYFTATDAGKSFDYNFGESSFRGLCCPQHLTNTLQQVGIWFSPVPW